MTRMWKGRRILSLVLALAMIMTMMPSMALPIYSENTTDQATTPADTTETSADTPNYGALVGATAQFNIATYINFTVDNDPATFNDDYYEGEWATHENYLYYDPDAGQCDFDADLTLVITDWYANPKTFGLWFKVEAAPGYTLPDMLAENPWVFQNWYDIYAEEDWEEISQDVLIITVPDGVYDAATGITVTGDLPENASVSVTVPEIDGEVLPNVFDIKVLVPNAEGELVEWQPAAGETVRVKIPVTVENDGYVNVAHILEDADKILEAVTSGKAQILKCGEVPEEYQHIFGVAVGAYQTAYRTEESCLVVEDFEKVPVVNGMATVDAYGFSIFINSGTTESPVYVESPTNAITELSNAGTKLYVRPGDWVRLNAGGALSTNFLFTTGSKSWGLYTETDPPSFVTILDQQDGWFMDASSYYFKVGDQATVGETFKVAYNSILGSDSLWGSFLVEFEVVQYWEQDDVRICIYTSDGYPVELSEFNPAAGYSYYKKNTATDGTDITLGTLFTPAEGSTTIPADEDSVYTYKPSDLISVDALKASDKYLTNTEQTVYGMVDTTGVSTTAFLTDTFNNSIAKDIVEEYCAQKGITESGSYQVVVYTIKYEAIGDNVGWYINCKVVPNDTYLLQYDYNFPSGFDQFDIDSSSSVKPGDQLISTEDAVDGVVSTTIGGFDAITLTATMTNPNNGTEQTRKAELLGWSTSSDAATAEYAVGSSTYELSMPGNTTLYAVWKITEGDWEYPSYTWTITNSLVNEQNKTVTGDSTFQYSINIGGNADFPTTYNVYDSAGNLTADSPRNVTPGQDGTITFEISGNQYIVIEGVQTKNSKTGLYYEYIVSQTERDGYKLLTENVTVNLEISTAKNTGNLTTIFINQQLVYNITYTLDGGENNSENPAACTVEDVVTLQAPTKEGYTFAGWYKEDTYATKVETLSDVSADVTLYAKWTINQYTITFADTGDTTIAPITQDYGTAVTAPADPSKTGYTFTGWDATIPATMPAGNMTVTAQWKINQYTITFDSNGGSVVAPITQDFGTAVTPPDAPTREGYIFNGWNDEIPATMPAGDMVITAQWTALYKYELAFTAGTTDVIAGLPSGYTSLDWETATSKTVSWSTVPTREGYNFVGWAISTGGTLSKETLSYTLTGTEAGTTTVTLTAQWEQKTYTIHYELGLTAERLENEEAFATDQVKEHGAAIDLYATVPTAVDANFVGWATSQNGEVIYQPGAQYTADAEVTLYAVWDPTPYTVKYTSIGLPSGTQATFTPQQGYFGDEFKVQTPDVAGYRITNIAVDGNNVPEGYVITLADSGVEVVITYEPISYEITFDANGGSEVSSLTYTIESDDALPTPSRTGYTFGGWKVTSPGGGWLLDAEFDAGTSLTGKYGDVTLTAQWTINQYTITFADTGDTTIAPITQNFGTAVTAPAEPTKAGYTFAGWNVEIPATMPAGDMTITALWTANQYTITFDSDGGSAVTSITAAYGSTVAKPADSTRDGYKFDGWYNGTEKVTFPLTMPLDGMALRAKWTIVQYTITYNLDDGQNHVDNPATYTVEDQITLYVPTKDGYNFTGWKVTTATGTWQTGTVYRDSLVIAAGQYGNVTLTAQWERALTTLTIKVEGCDTQLDADQSFIFTVTSNTTGENVDVDVTVLGNGQVCISGLVIGNSYTITMQTSWSWRYEIDSIVATVDADELVVDSSVTASLEDGETIVFTVIRNNSQWLDWFGGLFSNGN